ncbi:hypothetical protein [Myceligenerans salitolerans]|uniref:Uncharacterized protein n=1 Tax=Myceligenerans salitolerans TaxID=1230528 RepID=A0ABS3I9A6_9MICO|nr:hypothetical protein [Myceligenerans salitolerans]MBO0609604.1 hypothetical protein [Myceligenerans salitolerans]
MRPQGSGPSPDGFDVYGAMSVGGSSEEEWLVVSDPITVTIEDGAVSGG